MDSTIVLTLILILFDVIAGLVEAMAHKNFQSKKMREGLWHKVSEVLIVLFMAVMDSLLPFTEFKDLASLHISLIVCSYISVMEIGSIFENLGIALPDQLKKFFPNSKGGDDV